MKPIDLDNVSRNGWLACVGTLSGVRRAAAELNWTEAPLRRGADIDEVLRPLTCDAARPSSMSARVGLGAQPLHTDGAHLPVPPDVIAFEMTAPSTSPTLLSSTHGPGHPWDSLKHGIFSVISGVDRFYCVASELGRVRFDPICMVPCDQRARHVQQYFESELARAHVHRWENPNQVLVIDNRRVLHARATVDASDTGRSMRRVAFWRPEGR